MNPGKIFWWSIIWVPWLRKIRIKKEIVLYNNLKQLIFQSLDLINNNCLNVVIFIKQGYINEIKNIIEYILYENKMIKYEKKYIKYNTDIEMNSSGLLYCVNYNEKNLYRMYSII